MLDNHQESKVLLLLLYCYSCTTPKPHASRTSKPTQTDKVFCFGVLHSLEQPECSLGCHNLNSYRHRALCTRGLLLLYIGQTTRDKSTVTPVILLWLYSPKPPCTRNFQTYTDWKGVFYFAVSHNLQKPEGSLGCHNLTE